MDLGLADATAVVQGGTQGMGRAAAECFAAEGARVAVLARTQVDLDETVEHLRALGSPDTLVLRADLADAEQVDAAPPSRLSPNESLRLEEQFAPRVVGAAKLVVARSDSDHP